MGIGVVEQGRIEVRVLGSLELLVDGDVVELGRLRVRQLLARLVVTPETRVTAGSLIDHLWADNLPKDPAANLRVVVSRLRGALGEAATGLESDARGYSLMARTDWQQFQAALKRARDTTDTAERVELLGTAIRTWRGTAFSEHRSDPAMRALAGQLEDQRREATVLLGEALLDVGRASEAIGVVSDLYSSECDDERLCAVLAAALAGEGRKGEALDVLNALRELSRSGRGLELSASIDELVTSILEGAVDLGARKATAIRPAAPVTFVGREDVLASLLGVEMGLSVVVGGPGVGKSMLVDQVAANHARRHLIFQIMCTGIMFCCDERRT